MKANSFIDFESIGEGGQQHAVLSSAYKVLHGVFGGSGGKYAVAFPGARNGKKRRSVGGVIRVFAGSSADIYALLEKVKEHHVMRDYMRVSMPRDVPTDFSGEWVSWQRIRVQRREGVNRDKAIERATSSPYFEIKSSSGDVFALRFTANKALPKKEDFIPNSYGLASGGNRLGVGENIFALPVIK